MALTSVKLVNGSQELILWPRTDDGIYLASIDAPSPEVREVVDPRTDDDGTWDNTSLYGARACTVELLVASAARPFEDQVARYLHPSLRPYLVVADDGWAQTRRLMLRTDQWSAPLTTDLAPDQRKIQLQWKAPDGIWEAVDTVEETVLGDLFTDTGRTYPKTYSWSYPSTDVVGALIITNAGAAPVHFTAKLYGPCSGPQLINETTGERLGFLSGLALAAGEYVEIDTRAQTAYLLGNSSADRLNFLDFMDSSWWRLQPGDQQVRYAPLAGSSGTAAVITYRPAWL